MALVGHIVRETMGRVPAHVNRDDLTSAGLTALVQAGAGFDAERGVPFARYAATRIRGAILDELRSIDWASRSVRRRARDLDETRSQPRRRPRPGPDRRRGRQRPRPDASTRSPPTRTTSPAPRSSPLDGAAGRHVRSRHLLPAPSPSPEQLVEHRERAHLHGGGRRRAARAAADRRRGVLPRRAADGRDRRPSSASPSRGSPRCGPRPSSCSATPSTAQLEPELVAAPARARRLRRPSPRGLLRRRRRPARVGARRRTPAAPAAPTAVAPDSTDARSRLPERHSNGTLRAEFSLNRRRTRPMSTARSPRTDSST